MNSSANIYDIKTQKSRDVREALMSAIELAGSDADGALIIIARNNGNKTETISVGSLDDYAKAAFEGLKLQLNMVALHLKSER